MLAALLPLLEALGAEGGAAAGIGGTMESGLGGSLARMLTGGTRAFGSQDELGAALRKISDLQAGIQASQQALENHRQEQERVAHKAREDERQYAFSDPGHQARMLELNRQEQERREQIRRQQAEMTALRARANVTTDPAAARAASNAQMASTVGLIGTAAAFMPQQRYGPDKLSAVDMINPLKMMQRAFQRTKEGAANLGQAGANVGSFVAGQPNSQIISEGWSSFKQIFEDVRKLHPTAVIRDLSELPARIKGWSEALVESQRGISRFNGTLAMTFAEQERRTVIRAIESGQRTGGATADLSESLQRLYDQIQPMKDTVTVVVARSLTIGVNLLTEIVKQLQSFKPLLDQLSMKFLGMTEKQYEEFIKSFTNLERMRQQRAGAPLKRAFEDVMRRDPSQRIGVPRR